MSSPTNLWFFYYPYRGSLPGSTRLTRDPFCRSDFVVELRGYIREDIGTNPQIYVSLLVNGRPGPDAKTSLSAWDKKQFTIIQGGRQLDVDEVPKKGAVVMRYKAIILYWWMCKGWYTVRSEMYASEEVGGSRMTGFEGAVWVEGEASDSDCNPSDSDSDTDSL